MKAVHVILTAALLTVGGLALAQPIPSWAVDPSQKWPSDPELDSISHDLDMLRAKYPWDTTKVRALYVKHVVPNKEAYQRALLTGASLSKKDYFWCVALDAYFGELDIRRQPGFPAVPERLLQTVPFRSSAEFMRVAYCLYMPRGQTRIKDTRFAHRLLKMWPEDPLVMEAAAFQFQYLGSKQEKLKALAMMESLLKRFPSQESRYLPKMPMVCEAVRNVTMDAKYQKMALTYYDQIIASTKPSLIPLRKRYKLLREDCASVGRSLGLGTP